MGIVGKWEILDSRGIRWVVTVSDTGGTLKSLEGLASTTYCISKESSKYCGARQSGTGVRNYTRYVKALKEWDKQSYNSLMGMLEKHKVDYWAR